MAIDSGSSLASVASTAVVVPNMPSINAAEKAAQVRGTYNDFLHMILHFHIMGQWNMMLAASGTFVCFDPWLLEFTKIVWYVICIENAHWPVRLRLSRCRKIFEHV